MSIGEQLRSRVLGREWLAGTFINLGSSITAEIAGRCGFDWLMLDYEHGPGGDESLLHQLQAIHGTAAGAVVRIAANEAPRFKRVLDLGADGVMVPYVNTAAEAAAAVAASRFPPHGTRGVSKFNRAAGFGQGFENYYANAHHRVTVMAQIETPEAVENVDAIAAVEGVDVLFLGPLDLSTNLGIQSNFTHPKFVEAQQRVATACRNAGKAAGILLTSADQIPRARELGYTVIALGSDGGAVSSGLREYAALLKKPAVG
jgi:4-hydroxy-2-oxoheptanedioate aldolase